jgi:integrase
MGGEAGLRCGEMMAVEWSDVDLAKRQLRVGQRRALSRRVPEHLRKTLEVKT